MENKEQIKNLIEQEQRKSDPVNLIIDKQDELLEKINALDNAKKELDTHPTPISDFINDFINTLTKGEKGDKGDKGDSIKGDKGDKGDTGDDGYTPIKGIDYFDG